MPENSIRAKRSWLLSLATFTGLVGLLAAIWLAPGLLTPATPVDLVQAPDCILAEGPCRAGGEGRGLWLELEPGQPRALEPLLFRVRTEAIEATSMSILLEGRDMYMGYNRIDLAPVPGDPGLWSGAGELAICTTGEMVWLARIEAGTGDGSVMARFEFSAR